MRRSVIIDQDTLGPATSNLQAVAMLLNAPDVEVLGVTVVTGDHWRDVQVRHALRLLEIMGRPGVPVVPGAVWPLVQTPADVAAWERHHGRLVYNGAWDLARPGKFADPFATPDLPEGNPSLTPSMEPAAVFLTRLARAHPGEISLWCAGPLTNIALACRLDPDFPRLIREVHLMGGAFHAPAGSREFTHSPRREFNFRFDPEATRIVLRAPWPRLEISPVEVAQNLPSNADHFAAIARASTPLALYLVRFGQRNRPLWDEAAAATWIDPSLVTHHEEWLVDVDLTEGAGRGNTLSWTPGHGPSLGERPARVQRTIDAPRFFETFVHLLSR